VIKRIWFEATDRGGPWREAPGAPPGTAPLRVTETTTLPELEADPPWASMGTAWFADVEHLARFDAWCVPGGGTSLDADEVVVRGAEWLDARWADGGPRLKHLALARRRAGLSPTDLSRRWRAHAGSVGTRPIPAIARGSAYVQDHPVSRPDGEWAYDAVTEVWFDDLDSLRARIAWMAEALATAPPDDLFGERWLLAAREEVLARR
jgi:hypothetical protein